MPCDRDATFEPKTVGKRQRRLDGVDAMVISLVAKGLTTGEVQAQPVRSKRTWPRCTGARCRARPSCKITDRVLDELTGLAEPAVGPGLSGGVHRRDHGQDR